MGDGMDKDELHNVQGFTLELRERIDNLLIRFEALRRLLEPLGVTPAQYDQMFHVVTAEFRQAADRKRQRDLERASDARAVQRLSEYQGPEN